MAIAFPNYPIGGDQCGYGVIIINSFNKIPSLKREGTLTELNMFKQLFVSIGLEPIVFEELTKSEINYRLVEISRDDNLDKHSMIAVAIRYMLRPWKIIICLSSRFFNKYGLQ